MPEASRKPAERRRLTVAEFMAEVERQIGHAPASEGDHLRITFVCPMCACVQDGADFLEAGAGRDWAEIETHVGFSCIGQWKKAKPPRAKPDGEPCDWTVGGLFKVHTLEVMDEAGIAHPMFELAPAPKRAVDADEAAA
ncbi:MAG: hypothetical protein IBJ15_00065 [Alphaproteobacteria bacterium]|nr:hypothetical protein [Alphaproteobacteria bacterium]